MGLDGGADPGHGSPERVFPCVHSPGPVQDPLDLPHNAPLVLTELLSLDD